MYVRFGYGYSRQSNYCALVTSVQNTLVSYRKVRPFAFNSNLRYVMVLSATCYQAVAKHNLSFYAHMRLYFTHKMTEIRIKFSRICQLSGQGIEPCNVRWTGVCTSHGTLPALPPRYPLRYPIIFIYYTYIF